MTNSSREMAEMVAQEKEASFMAVSRISNDEIKQIRLRQERLESDYLLPTELFRTVYDEGLDRVQKVVDELHPKRENYSEEQIQQVCHQLAIEMTKAIQQEFNYSLSDTDMKNMYGMMRDHVTHAFDRAVDYPEPGEPSKWRAPRRRRAQIRQYVIVDPTEASDEQGGADESV